MCRPALIVLGAGWGEETGEIASRLAGEIDESGEGRECKRLDEKACILERGEVEAADCEHTLGVRGVLEDMRDPYLPADAPERDSEHGESGNLYGEERADGADDTYAPHHDALDIRRIRHGSVHHMLS